MRGQQVHYMPEFKKRLYECVLASDIDVTVLASKCGISRGSLHDYLYTERIPGTFILMRLCEVLNVSADYLIFGRGKAPKYIKKVVVQKKLSEEELRERKYRYNQKYYYSHREEMLDRAKKYRDLNKEKGITNAG